MFFDPLQWQHHHPHYHEQQCLQETKDTSQLMTLTEPLRGRDAEVFDHLVSQECLDASITLADSCPTPALTEDPCDTTEVTTLPYEQPLACQSLTWTSPEFEHIKDFNRITEKLHHLGMGSSPFLPTSPGELLGLRAETLAAKTDRMITHVEEKEDLARLRKVGRIPAESPRLYGGREMNNGLSPVLAISLCRNANLPFSTASTDGKAGNNNDDESRRGSPWPGFAKHKAWGCTLPLPRVIVEAAEAEMAEKETAWLSHGIEPGSIAQTQVVTASSQSLRTVAH